jgi:chemotaxis protein histidine kinase CheA/FixJ family two-component response regulator
VSTPGNEIVEIFLQEASEHLQFLREYSGILQDPYPANEDVERLYISAHTLTGTSASYGYPLFSEVSGKLAHIFQYVLNTSIGQDAAGPLVEFISEAVALLESDLLMISATGAEALEDIDAFKQRYPFAFQQAPQPEPEVQLGAPLPPPAEVLTPEGTWAPAETPAVVAMPAAEISIADLSPDGEVPTEILEFFVPEAEEHLQTITECLLALETSTNPQDIHRLFRAMHTIKGSAAQVGLQRISRVAHRAEDLVGRLRDGELRPSAQIVDLCLEAVDVLKKFIYRKWTDEATIQSSVKSLLARIARLAPEELEVEGAPAAPEVSAGSANEIAAAATVVATAEELKAAMAAAQQSVPGTQYPVPSAQDSAREAQAAQVAPPVVPASLPELKVESEPGAPPDLEIVTGRGEPIAVPQSKSVRIALERLDQMMNAVGELVINRTRMLGRLAELEKLADVLNFSKARMSDKVAEFQEKYEFSLLAGSNGGLNSGSERLGNGRPSRSTSMSDPYPFRGGYSSYSNAYDPALADFSELEMDRYDDFSILSRSLTEISADITEVLSQLDGFVRRVDADIDEFTKLAHRLQDEITAARMVPIGNLYTRLSRTVRDAAKATGKRVQLTLAGAETELDNNIIQQISDPLIHLTRNAVAHGIERDDERYQAGKSDHGNIAVRAYHRGNHIYVEVEDDGRGVDYEKVRATAVDAGLVDEDDADELSEAKLLEFLFHPGFTTAPKKTELAGRGVGLDVVRSNITDLNGEIDIETQKGLGTRFTLKVPLTLIISQALFVRCGDSVFALPLAVVEEIRRLRLADIEEVAGKMLTKVRDVTTEVVRLDAQLALPLVEPVNGYYRLVIVNVGGRQVGLLVEEVLRKDEIVIKNLGEYLNNVKLFSGATIAPDGSLILLIDVNRLVAGEAVERRPLMTMPNAAAARIFAPGAAALAAGEIPAAAVEPVIEQKVIVLADDSISVRKFVGRMLEKAGYRVKLASDGLEALEIATQSHCDLLITDLEMPRTNGYELMSHLRQQPETRKIPVLVVTSRAGAKHRDRAMKEGASAFMVKPVQEDQLLAVVAELVGTGTGEKKAAEIAKAHSAQSSG